MLEEYASAEVEQGKVVYDVIDKTPKVVSFKTQEISTLLGLNLTDDDVKVELARLDFEYKYDNGIFTVTIPNRY